MYQRILVPFDGSPTSSTGLDEAIRLARLSHGAIRLVHVLDELRYATGFETFAAYCSDVIPMMKRAGEALLAGASARVAATGIAVDSELLESGGERTAERINEAALRWPADLIVIGTHGRRGAARLFMGSDAEQILRTAPVPVLLVRAAGALATV